MNCYKKKCMLGISLLVLLVSCKPNDKEVSKEWWIDKPVAEWPTFALVNKIQFKDSLLNPFGNAFLLDTGKDTLAITCKHVFLGFERYFGINTIDLGDSFEQWQCYAPNSESTQITLDTLINKNTDEMVVPFRQMKIKDWLIFSIKDLKPGYYPLKIRTKPVLKYEVVYAVGWSTLQTDTAYPEKTILQCYDNMGDYFYVNTLSKNTTPNGKSGSPVVDENGYLVGIVSGAEGKLGVIGSVAYLLNQLDQHSISYDKHP